jgi:precorrin-3B synthase
MEAADGMLLRVRVPGGAIAADGLRTVADVAERFGSGVVELTVRANLQIRGVRPSDVAAAGEELVRSGLALADPIRDERRDVIGSPLAGHDPTELVDLSAVLAEVADRLAAEPGLDGLPPKFGVVLDGGGAAPVRSIPADVALGAVRAADGRPVLQVELGRPVDAGAPDTCIAVDDAVPVVLAAAHLAAIHAERLTTLVDLLGREAVVGTVIAGASKAGSQGCRPVGELVDAARRPAPRLSAHEIALSLRDTGAATSGHPAISTAPIGASPHRDGDRVNVGVAPFLGRTDPSALRSVAHVAAAVGASVRLTPWRGLVLVDASRSQRQAATVALAAAGFSADPADPAHLVSACVGRPGCAASRADTQAAGRALLQRGGVASRIHLSGCEKRCGAGAAPTVVAGDDGAFEVGPW